MADAGWDLGETIFIGANDEAASNATGITRRDAEDGFYNFLVSFRDAENSFVYRDQLRSQYLAHQYFLQVHLQDVTSYNNKLGEALRTMPSEYLPMFELAAKRAADEVTSPRPDGSAVHDIQIMLTSDQNPLLLRDLQSDHVSKLIRIPGIVIKASTVKVKATQLRIQCQKCHSVKDVVLRPGMSGVNLPRTCDRPPMENEEKCPLDPYQIVGEKSLYVNQQTLKLQESPDLVPQGELPRHVQVSADRYLTRRIAPGSRVTVVGVYEIIKHRPRGGVAEQSVRLPYIRAVGFMQEKDGDGRSTAATTAEDEAHFRAMGEDPELYAKIAQSICPEIFGSDDIKKAVACMLFGGSRKQLRDGMRLRGDVNVLLLGDPGTAKSQLLKRVEKLAPVAVYTSGKGSSAAGLTASVVRDASSRDFYLEAGAMVLADGGVVCIDEFDKMREEDRVAIHEAMEQQTISIAKAGITTVLNSRCSVLAAANSTFGRWDDSHDAGQNIDMQATILSRFDMIFVVKDVFSEEQDASIARHVLGFHRNASSAAAHEATPAAIDQERLRKYINFARRTCGPRLSADAAAKLRDEFVQIRSTTRGHRNVIPITIRQLEAIVRMSESLAKMRLAKFATESDVEEALRLFRISTLQAAMNNDLANGPEGGQGEASAEMLLDIERMIKRRMPMGAKVSERTIIDDLCNRKDYTEYAVKKAIFIMVRRGEMEYSAQRKILTRVQP